jgi:hypothetical protein
MPRLLLLAGVVLLMADYRFRASPESDAMPANKTGGG